jgi:hypothetical protein
MNKSTTKRGIREYGQVRRAILDDHVARTEETLPWFSFPPGERQRWGRFPRMNKG